MWSVREFRTGVCIVDKHVLQLTEWFLKTAGSHQKKPNRSLCKFIFILVETVELSQFLLLTGVRGH